MWIPEQLSRAEIEKRSQRLLIDPLQSEFGKEYLLRNGVRFQDLYERVIWPRYKIDIREGVDLSRVCDGGALGVYHPTRNLVEIDAEMASVRNDPRRVFTIYHEVCGHGVLQGDWLRAQWDFPGRRMPIVETDATLDLGNREILEWQANTMAGMCAAPQWLVDAQLMLRLEMRGRRLEYRGPGTYFFGARGRSRRFEVISFEDFSRALAKIIHPWFDGLSIQALGYRVMRSQCVRDLTVVSRYALLRAS